MIAALDGGAPNPSGAHRPARAAAASLDRSRRAIAASLGVDARSVILTGGGTESCAAGVLGPRRPTAVCVSAIEHVAVRRSAEVASARRGVPLIELAVGADGRIVLDQALDVIPDGALVSVMAANNETGVVQPVVELVERLREDREVIVHCDAIAAAPTRSLAEVAGCVDLLSMAAHKMGGPPGVGVLVVAGDLDLEPLVPGGSQERGLRGGTQDVAGAAGMAVALEAADGERLDGRVEALGRRRDALADDLEGIEGVVVTARGLDRLAGHLHLTLPGVRSEEVLVLLDRAGVAASAGAACASGAPQASRVLTAMGMDDLRARSALRLTLGTETSEEAWRRLAEVVPEVLASLAEGGRRTSGA
jgi:cysteine desulfurase